MYSTLMVYLDPSADNTGLLQVTADLAERFKAGVLGVSAARLVGRSSNVSELAGGVVDRDREELEDLLEAAKKSFLAVLQPAGHPLEWRAIVTSDRVEAVAIRHARCADLVIVTANYAGSLTTGTPYLNTSDLVMQAGRPLLIVPPATAKLTARNIFVAWKDTRQARRAVSDALPLLQTADRVIVVEVAGKKYVEEAKESVTDVVDWLKAHGVKAEGMTVPEQGRNASQLDTIAKAEGADLIVAGAYHHRRLRQWALGGVTRNLLLDGDLCTLVSH